MIKQAKNEIGVTLLSLVILIVVLSIIIGMSVYNAKESVESSNISAFTSEYKIMQSQVDLLYEKMKNDEEVDVNGKKYKGSGNTEEGILGIQDIGYEIEGENEAQANRVFDSTGVLQKDRENYKYYSVQLIKNELGVEGITQDFLVNIQTRDILSYNGIKYKNVLYYNLKGLPDELYNVKYDAHKGTPTFSTQVEEVSNGWEIDITDIKYDGYINTWKVKYKGKNEEDWKTTDNLTILVEEDGEYIIKIFNEDVESEEQTIDVRPQYVQNGLVLHYDGINNTGNGHSNTTNIWKDLSGNDKDGILQGDSTDVWNEDGLNFNGIDNGVKIGQMNYQKITLEAVCEFGEKTTQEMHIISNMESRRICNINICCRTKFKIYRNRNTYWNDI